MDLIKGGLAVGRHSLFLALYAHSSLLGHSRHFVADPADFGFCDFLKCERDPNEETLTGVDGPR